LAKTLTFQKNLIPSQVSKGSFLTFTRKDATPSEIDKIIEATGIPVIPILSTDRDTQSAIEMLQKVSPEIGLESIRKLALVEGIIYTAYRLK